jgi:16S rRNA (guanine966-N2)-methyltransferase
MRITGGRLKGRILATPAGRDIRPTSDRTRQAIFNILAHATWAPALEGATVLDAFCGTGALALEALSHGAARATLFDVAAAAVTLSGCNARALGVMEAVTIKRASALKPPPALAGPVDLVFLDPPYATEAHVDAALALARVGWLGPNSALMLERAARRPLEIPARWIKLDSRAYGSTVVEFWQPPNEAHHQPNEVRHADGSQ